MSRSNRPAISSKSWCVRSIRAPVKLFCSFCTLSLFSMDLNTASLTNSSMYFCKDSTVSSVIFVDSLSKEFICKILARVFLGIGPSVSCDIVKIYLDVCMCYQLYSMDSSSLLVFHCPVCEFFQKWYSKLENYTCEILKHKGLRQFELLSL